MNHNSLIVFRIALLVVAAVAHQNQPPIPTGKQQGHHQAHKFADQKEVHDAELVTFQFSYLGPDVNGTRLYNIFPHFIVGITNVFVLDGWERSVYISDDWVQSAHIKQHLDGKINVEDQMTNEQLQYHYFKMHDSNDDNRLDGIELIKAITHFHDEKDQHDPNATPPPLMAEKEMEDMIDAILKDDDFNNDGYIDYAEFLEAQKQRSA